MRNGGHYEGQNFPFSVFLLFFLFLTSIYVCVIFFLLIAFTTRQEPSNKRPLATRKTAHRNASAFTKATQQRSLTYKAKFPFSTQRDKSFFSPFLLCGSVYSQCGISVDFHSELLYRHHLFQLLGLKTKISTRQAAMFRQAHLDNAPVYQPLTFSPKFTESVLITQCKQTVTNNCKGNISSQFNLTFYVPRILVQCVDDQRDAQFL